MLFSYTKVIILIRELLLELPVVLYDVAGAAAVQLGSKILLLLLLVKPACTRLQESD